MELLENAKKELELLEKTEQELQEQLKLAPKGILHVSKSNGIFQYYSIKNGRKNYIPVKNKQLVKNLIQRDYNIKLMKTVSKNIQALKILFATKATTMFF